MTEQITITLGQANFTCPDCNMPQGEDYFTNSKPYRVAVTHSGDRLECDLCEKCHSRLVDGAPNQRTKRLGVIARRVLKRPEKYITKEEAS